MHGAVAQPPPNDAQAVPKQSLPAPVNFTDFKAFSHDVV